MNYSIPVTEIDDFVVVAGRQSAPSNMERFKAWERRTAETLAKADDPKRFLYQMTIADKVGAKKLITWEAMHFMNPAGDQNAHLLRQACKQIFWKESSHKESRSLSNRRHDSTEDPC